MPRRRGQEPACCARQREAQPRATRRTTRSPQNRTGGAPCDAVPPGAGTRMLRTPARSAAQGGAADDTPAAEPDRRMSREERHATPPRRGQGPACCVRQREAQPRVARRLTRPPQNRTEGAPCDATPPGAGTRMLRTPARGAA
jgi:hypothetical protein